jgi:hypothetical protein
MQAVQQTVNYAPTSQKDWPALLAYIGANRDAIELRKTSDYFAETNACAITLSKHFAINPPQLKIKVCPWEQLGVRAKVKAIALKYSVPATMVSMDVGSALSY